MGMSNAIAHIAEVREAAGLPAAFDVGVVAGPVYLGAPDFEIEPYATVGTAEQLAERLGKFPPKGINQIQLGFRGRDAAEMADQVRRFGAEVAPLLAGLSLSARRAAPPAARRVRCTARPAARGRARCAGSAQLRRPHRRRSRRPPTASRADAGPGRGVQRASVAAELHTERGDGAGARGGQDRDPARAADGGGLRAHAERGGGHDPDHQR